MQAYDDVFRLMDACMSVYLVNSYAAAIAAYQQVPHVRVASVDTHQSIESVPAARRIS